MHFQFRHIYVNCGLTGCQDPDSRTLLELICLDSTRAKEMLKEKSIFVPNQSVPGISLEYQMALTVDVSGTLSTDRKLFLFDHVPYEWSSEILKFTSYIFIYVDNSEALVAKPVSSWSDYLSLCTTSGNALLDVGWVRR